MLERDIEKAVCQFARDLGCKAYKFTSPAQRAVPDRIIVFPNGYLVFIEFKAPKARPTELQWREHRDLLDRGQLVAVIDNVADGKALIEEVIRLPRINVWERHR